MILKKLSGLFATILTLLFGGGLSGCSTSAPREGTCTKTALVSSLARLPLSKVLRRPESRSVTISSFKGGCGGADRDLPGGYDDIGVKMTFAVPPSRLATGINSEVSLPLFVAVLDKDNNVIDRHDETVQMTITDQPLEITRQIVYRPPQGVRVDNMSNRILVGFNMDVSQDYGPVTVLSPEKHHPKRSNKKRVVLKRKTGNEEN